MKCIHVFSSSGAELDLVRSYTTVVSIGQDFSVERQTLTSAFEMFPTTLY